MKIAICDDDSRCLEHVLDLLHDYDEECKDHTLEPVRFSSPEELLTTTKQGVFYDIYLLDIMMPHINGIQLGEALRATGSEGKIIYLTSSKEYALDSFRIRAFHYLIKPVEKAPFFQVLDEALHSIQIKRDKGMIIKTKEGTSRLTFDSILYAKLSKRSIVYHLTNGKTLESNTLRGTFADSVSEIGENHV